ncbi:MAG TPA: glycosyltransferase family 2 protein [Geobacteraceae bacterium]|nr:glycosyltransferase family 2 protein [Geobacteraceae bacterium]
MITPRVTVCIPAYNNARFLPEAIESVLSQSFDQLELLIIDDSSTDSTREIVSSYAARDNRIVFRVNPRNIGMVENWNACLREARGEYIKYLFGDDLLASPDALQKMVGVLDSDRTVSLVASARNLIDEDSALVGTISCFAGNTVGEGAKIINRCLLTQKNLIGEPSVVMFRKSQAARGFDARYSQFVDLEMWFHLLEQGKFSYIGEPLASFRLHAGQQTRKNVRDLVHVDEMIALMDEYGGRPYVKLGQITRRFLQYHQLYRIWKVYRNGTMSREDALVKISRHCAPRKFLALVPLYKVVSPVWKLKCFVGSLAGK